MPCSWDVKPNFRHRGLLARTGEGRYHCVMSDSDLSQHAAFLRRAVELSRRSLETAEGGPFGAVIVRDGEVLAEAWNRVIAASDPTAHAEVLAIREACRSVADFQLPGSILYSSCEPCPMCLSAAYWARVERIYYANTREEAAAIGFCDAELYRELSLPGDRRRVPAQRLLLDDAFEPMRLWAELPGRILY
ncbi:MAG: nucleoside deaminase [Sulfuricellaceae bacterium]|jgi:guanine deaminase